MSMAEVMESITDELTEQLERDTFELLQRSAAGWRLYHGRSV